MARTKRIVEGDPRFNERPKPPVEKDVVITEEAPQEDQLDNIKETIAKDPSLKDALNKKKKVNTKSKGGPIPVKTDEEKALEKKKKEDYEASQKRIKELNKCANFMLACLEPGFAADWKQAAQEQRVKDIGVYVLGVFNRLSKMVDYMESDIEPEWDQGLVGYNEHLFCEYCTKEISPSKTTNLKQRFCSNLCAKRYKDAHTTGIIYPTSPNVPSEEELDEKGWQREAKREGVING